MLSDDLVRGQAQHLIGALIAHEFLPKAMPHESYIVLWDVVMRQLKCVNQEGARAIESAATAPLLAEIERLTRELEEARKDTAMLDWLDKQNADIENDAWVVLAHDCAGDEDCKKYWVGADLRSAIRAAIKEQT